MQSNMEASRSLIMDANYAKESTELVFLQVERLYCGAAARLMRTTSNRLTNPLKGSKYPKIG